MASDYSGMTPNERLFVTGLLDEHDRLKATGDVEALNRLLARVNLKFENESYWDLDPADVEN